MMSEERPGEEEKKDGNDEADELHGNVRKFNRCRIESETDTEESEDATESNEGRGDKGKIQMIESDSEEEIRGRGRVIYSSEEEEPIPTSKGLFDNFSEETREFIEDEMGRQHFTCPRSGEGHMFLASAQINPSTAQAHVNDIVAIFNIRPELKKPILQLITDDGKSFSFVNKSLQIILF